VIPGDLTAASSRNRKRWAPLAVAWLVLLPLGVVTPRGQDQAATFLNFTVKARGDIYVRDLKQEELTLELDGRPVEVRYLGGRDVSTSALIVLENSPRTAQQPVSIPQWGQINPIDRIRYLLLDDFFPQITANGEVMLAQFFTEFEVIHDFSGDESRSVMALQDMQLNFAGVVMNNIHVGRALGRGLDLLKRREARRKLLIFVTASVDRDAYLAQEEYREMFRYSDVELYTIAFAPRFASTSNFTFEEKMTGTYLRALAGETAGHAYLVSEYAYLDGLFTDLKGRIANMYTIGFYPPREGGEYKVSIRVDRPKAQVSHRPSIRVGE
jgi:hypothetical protein